MYVCIEGVDGCGKTSVIKALGYPNFTPLGGKLELAMQYAVRGPNRAEIHPFVLQMMMVASAKQQDEDIVKPYFYRNPKPTMPLVGDRWTVSSGLAYFTSRFDSNDPSSHTRAALESLHDIAGLVAPALVVLLVGDPRELYARCGRDDVAADLGVVYLRRVQAIYKTLAATSYKARWVVVDTANKELKRVVAEVQALIPRIN